MKIINLLLLTVAVMLFPFLVLGQTKEEIIENSKMFNESGQYARTGDYDHAILILNNLVNKESDKTKIAMYYNNMGFC